MKYLFSSVSIFAMMLLVPFVSSAASLAEGDAGAGEIGDLMSTIVNFIDQYIIPFILAIAFLLFVWGVFKYFVQGGADEEKQTEGKNLMLYAVAGFVLILSFYGIVNLLVSGLGFSDKTLDDIPNIQFPANGSGSGSN